MGQAGTQKLKKTLQDAKIDRPFRDILPVFARGNRVLWIVGLKPSSDAAITDTTKKKVKIMYQGKLPWEM
jgi:tRNA(Ile)-lysidine synthetase-like protein